MILFIINYIGRIIYRLVLADDITIWLDLLLLYGLNAVCIRCDYDVVRSDVLDILS